LAKRTEAYKVYSYKTIMYIIFKDVTIVLQIREATQIAYGDYKHLLSTTICMV